MEFAGFDDDLFDDEQSSEKVQLVQESGWTVHRSEPGWFHEKGDEINVAFSIKHFHANHLYYTGKYSEAAQTFTELAKLMPTGNHQREVSEGLARSLMKFGDIKKAIEAAKQFELSCKSKTQFASYHSLCGEIYKKGLDQKNELFHLQLAIKTHALNADLWLRIAECYGMMSNIDITAVPFAFSKEKDATWYAAASLLRVEIIMKSVAGRESIGALKKKRNQKLRSLVQPIIASFPPVFAIKAQEALSRDVYNLEPQTQEEGEFVDLGSSKRDKNLECEDDDAGNASLTEQQEYWFEKHWFSFADSIQDINLYYIPPDNTHGCDA